MKRSLGFLLASVVLSIAAAGCSLMEYCPMHMAMRALTKSNAPAQAPADTAIQQTTCPVMGGKINPAVHTDYEGRRVYFCCPKCIDAFKKTPQQYLAKLDAQTP